MGSDQTVKFNAIQRAPLVTNTNTKQSYRGAPVIPKSPVTVRDLRSTTAKPIHYSPRTASEFESDRTWARPPPALFFGKANTTPKQPAEEPWLRISPRTCSPMRSDVQNPLTPKKLIKEKPPQEAWHWVQEQLQARKPIPPQPTYRPTTCLGGSRHWKQAPQPGNAGGTTDFLALRRANRSQGASFWFN